jgi:copper chaperone CopZ
MNIKNKDSHMDKIFTTEDTTTPHLGSTSDHTDDDCCGVSKNPHMGAEQGLGQGEGFSASITSVSLSIWGMSCHSCARKIEEALSRFPGVTEAEVDFVRREARVDFDADMVNLNDLNSAVEGAGYQVLDSQEDQIKGGKRKSVSPTGLLASPRPYLFAGATILCVIGFYLGLLTLTSDWYNAKAEFKEYGGWILALAVGLGVQVALFSLLRTWHRRGSMKAAKAGLAASGGMSTTAMAACCSHYLTILLPALGLPFLSSAAASLSLYQTYFFLAGVLSNLVGIGLMLRVMQRNGMIQIGAHITHFGFGLRRIRQ